MLVQPFSSVIVPVPPEKKPSVQFSAATVTNCTLARVKMTIVLSADAGWLVMPHVCTVLCGRTPCHILLFHSVPSPFFFPLSFSKASTTSVLFSRCIWLYQLSIAWNEICACVCQWLCALPYLHSRNASTPPKLSRSRRQTTAAVALLFSVSQGAVNQEKTADERRNKEKQTQRNKKNRGHLAWLFLEGKKVPCNNSTQSLNWLEHQGITGGILKNPDCRWIIMPLGRYEELHLSCLFSSSGSGSGSSVGSDLLIALWKILYHWNTTGDTIHRTEQKRNQDTASIDTMHYVQESDSLISMTQCQQA